VFDFLEQLVRSAAHPPTWLSEVVGGAVDLPDAINEAVGASSSEGE
jgi:hypothetical protein